MPITTGIAIGDTTKTVAAEQVGSVWMQGFMLCDSAGNVLTMASPATLEATPGIDASSYSDGDNLDGTIITLAGAAVTAAGGGYIDHVQIIDKSASGGTSKNMMVVFCRSAITPNAQNAAFTLDDTQSVEVTARVTTSDSDWYTLGGSSIAEVDVSPPVPYKIASGTSLYAVVKLLGAFTFGSTSDVIIRVHVIPD